MKNVEAVTLIHNIQSAQDLLGFAYFSQILWKEAFFSNSKSIILKSPQQRYYEISSSEKGLISVKSVPPALSCQLAGR